MLKRRKMLFVGICLIFFINGATFLAMGREIVLATGEWQPYTSESLDDYGEFTRVVSLVLEEMGVEASYVFYPWSRCFDAVLNGQVWAAFPYSPTPERRKRVWFSNALSCSRTLFFYYEEGVSKKKYVYRSLEDLKKYRVGGVRGYYYEDIFMKVGLPVDFVNKELNGIEKLKRGRIDLMLLNDKVGWDLIKKHFPDDLRYFKVLDKPLSVDPLQLMVSTTYPDSERLLFEFNKALLRIIEKGILHVDACKEKQE